MRIIKIKDDTMENTARQIELSEVENDLISEIKRVREDIRASMAIQARKGNTEAAWLKKHL
jgi:hypothetical protein